MTRHGSETHRPLRRSNGVTRNARRIAAATLITTATLATMHADVAGAGVSCSLRVVDRTADTMTLRYDPHDNVARTVWVDGQPTTIAPHSTATVRRAGTLRYPTQGEVVDVAELIAMCGGPTTTTTEPAPTTTTSSSTTSTTPPSTTTSALTTITVVRTTPEPAPLPPATWTVVPPATTVQLRTVPTLPETGPARAVDIITLGGWLALVGLLVVLATRQRD